MSSDIYSGTVSSLVYENEDFRIVKLVMDETSKIITVKGNFPAQNIGVGAWVSFEGKWVRDSRYGDQLSVVRSPVGIPRWSDDQALAALSSNGVGPTIRMSLRIAANAAGISVADLLDSGDLSPVGGLDEFGQTHTLSRWRSIRTYLDGAAFMSNTGLSSAVIGRVWRVLGSELEENITEDPWILVRVGGVSFNEADEVARRLGVCLDAPGRVRGAVLSAVQEIVFEGHVYATTGQVVRTINRLIPGKEIEPRKIAEALGHLVKKGALVADRETVPGVVAIYDSWHHRIEKKCAKLLRERFEAPLDEEHLIKALCRVGDRVRDAKAEGAGLRELVEKALESWAGGKADLTGNQLAGAVNSLMSQVSLLTGLPGTGKTTTLRAVVSVLRDMEIPFLLAAPTGIAAKRMSSVTGAEASTVHRAFGAKGFTKDNEEREATYVGIVGKSSKKSTGSNEGEDWGFGPGNPHPAQVVVVDESSMLDLHMLYRLLSATSPTCRIVFVGDPYQLPSVGAGDVLRDLVSSAEFPHTHLTDIFRQEETSGIVIAAHKIHAGKSPESDGKDFIVYHAPKEDKAAEVIVEMAKKLYEKRYNFQVLSPRHAGDAGVTALNQRLRIALNPSLPGVHELKVGKSVIREDDRIQIVKNDYTLGVYNGDVGKVSKIDRRSKEVEVKIFEGEGESDKMIRIPFKEVSQKLRLAYAQTIHKSQGQEYDYIVVALLSSFGRQLQRNLLYTAITRAKKKVFVIGSQTAVSKAVLNNEAQTRNTLLVQRVQGGGPE
jgi:exodeoxyribonuclease V alpha subunit